MIKIFFCAIDFKYYIKVTVVYNLITLRSDSTINAAYLL